MTPPHFFPFSATVFINLLSRKHQRPGTRYWVKVTPLVKESAWNPETEMAAEESLDIHDVRSRLGGWPIVEAAVSYIQIFCVLCLIMRIFAYLFLESEYLNFIIPKRLIAWG